MIPAARRRVYAPGSGLSTDWTGLLAYWKFDGGSLADATGNGKNLTGANFPGSATGHIGSGDALELLTASNQYVFRSVAGGDSFQMGTGVSLAIGGWINLQAGFPGDMMIAGQYSQGAVGPGNSPYCITHDSGSGTRWYFNNGAKQIALGADGLSNSTSTWQFLICGYDAPNDLLYWSRDGAAKSTITASGNFAGATTDPFNIGLGDSFGVFISPKAYFDGWFLYKGVVLSNTVISHLYNSGNGKDYPT